MFWDAGAACGALCVVEHSGVCRRGSRCGCTHLVGWLCRAPGTFCTTRGPRGVLGGAQGMGHCRQHAATSFPSHMPRACQKQFAINWDVPLCLCKEAEQEQKLLFIMPMPLAALRNGEC